MSFFIRCGKTSDPLSPEVQMSLKNTFHQKQEWESDLASVIEILAEPTE